MITVYQRKKKFTIPQHVKTVLYVFIPLLLICSVAVFFMKSRKRDVGGNNVVTEKKKEPYKNEEKMENVKSVSKECAKEEPIYTEIY